jgi:hypothetical protein
MATVLRASAADASSADNKLGSIVMRTLEAGLDPLSTTSLRATGFRALNHLIEAQQLRTAAPLPVRSEVVLDQAVMDVGMQRLAFVADLLAEGLTYNLPDPLSVPFLEHQTRNQTGTARRVMNPSSRGENSLPKMSSGRLPIYLTMADFQLDIRTLRMSQRVGIPLDTAGIQSDTRAVNEAIEDAAINGATTLDGQAFQVDGYTAKGLLNAPNANVATLTASAWSGTSPVGATVFAEILAMISTLVGDKKYGPYNLYVPTAVNIALNMDFKANGNDSILARIGQINTGGRPLRIRPLDYMPATKVALVQMTSDVVDIVDGQRPTVIPYTSLDGFTIYNVIMAIMVPRFRSDYDGNSGVVIGTLT